ncbi:MAG: sensor histidine kinase [Acidimicrobiia bacterium]
MLEDRERIARDLHDRVIQQLFATGMALQATQRLTDDPAVTKRIAQAIDDLDATIREIRNTIFALHQPSVGLEAQLRALAKEMDSRLHCTTVLHAEGPIDTAVPETVADQLPAVVRELVTNACRHGGAQHLDVLVRVDANCTVRVADDGTGIADFDVAVQQGGRGLVNLLHRAEALGGRFGTVADGARGSVVEWTVPLD